MKNRKWFLALVAAAGAMGCVPCAHAQEVWVNAGMLSYHFDRSRPHREFNYGLGAEAIFAPDHALMAGTYKNSESFQSHYLGYVYRPFHWTPSGLKVSAGVALSVVDGYPSMNDRGWFAAPIPVVMVEGKKIGANFILLPNFNHGAALAMQLKLKAW